MCDTKYCNKCHEISSATHICKTEDMESAKTIIKDSKSCPSCHVITYKVSGCSQMWCTQCHTVWNWSTATVEKGTIHNPHYFEYMRRQGTLPEPNQQRPPGCEAGQIYLFEIAQTTNRLKIDNPPHGYNIFIYNMMRLRNHVIDVELRRYASDVIRENRELRIRYLLNEIDEPWFKRLLQQREKLVAKKQEYEQIMRMLGDVLLDLMMKLVRSTTKEAALAIEKEFHALCRFANDSFENSGKMFKCKYPKIQLDSRMATFTIELI